MIDDIITLFALAGLAGCFDIARRMSLKTRHSMRLAVIVIGLGCVLAAMHEPQWGLIFLLAGCGLYRFFDVRKEGWQSGRTDPGGIHSLSAEPLEHARRPDELAHPPGHAVGGVVSISAHRQNHDVARRVSA
jgi:hypothetical protein